MCHFTIGIIYWLPKLAEASLIPEDGETRWRPGNVVIQRGKIHAWQAFGGPASLAVLIDRELARNEVKRKNGMSNFGIQTRTLRLSRRMSVMRPQELDIQRPLRHACLVAPLRHANEP